MGTGLETSSERRVIIHCGVQKTASTSLHHFVSRNRKALADQVEVWIPAKGTSTRALGRTAMGYSLSQDPEALDKLVELTARLRDAALKGKSTLIISHENLCGAMLGKGDVTTLYPNLDEIVEVLTEHMAPIVPEFAVYTRDMAAWKRSVHNQAVKSDYYPHRFDRFLDDTADCGTWDQFENRFQTLVGADRVRFFRIEDEGDPARPGLQLLRHAGLSEDRIAALEPLTGRANQSLNTGALEFMRLVNTLDLERTVRARVADLVTANPTLFVAG